MLRRIFWLNRRAAGGHRRAFGQAGGAAKPGEFDQLPGAHVAHGRAPTGRVLGFTELSPSESAGHGRRSRSLHSKGLFPFEQV